MVLVDQDIRSIRVTTEGTISTAVRRSSYHRSPNFRAEADDRASQPALRREAIDDAGHDFLRLARA
jgi:hypothetical protein